MTQRRIVYFMALTAAVVFYWANRAWLSALLLMVALLLPWLSLLLSLPSVLGCKITLQCPDRVTVGSPVLATCNIQCRFPVAVVGGKLRLYAPVTGKTKKIEPGVAMLTSHCGAFRVQCRHLWITDYLGLFRLPVRFGEDRLVLVRPVAALPAQMPDMSRYLCGNTRPKPGGGYAENHELRLYRPGDSLQQIHWKLSAKTGQLIIREPMETLLDTAALTMELSGQPDMLDKKLGLLLGMSTHLAEEGIKHRIFCYTGKGMAIFRVTNGQEALDAVDSILQLPTVGIHDIPNYPKAIWRYHIGGDDSEN